MRLLRVYLWKEWREQRWILAALAGGLTVVMAILTMFLPTHAWQPGFTYDWVVGLCVLTALFTVGSDLLSRENRRERLQFLERAPAGLRTAFLAKLVFFVTVMVWAAAFGVGLAAGVAWIRTGALPAGFFEQLDGYTVPMLAAGVFWVFAVSAWVRTGAMALPSALLLLAAFSLPCWLVRTAFGAVRASEITLLVWLILVGAVVTALWSFVVGVGRSRPRRVVVLGGLGVAALFFSPSWALAAIRYHEFLHVGSWIDQAWIGAGGRYAWLGTCRGRPGSHQVNASLEVSRPTALLLDLESGDWDTLGSRDLGLIFPHSEWMPRYFGLFGDAACPQFRLLDFELLRDEFDEVFFDARTAEPVSPGTPLEVPDLEVAPADFGLEEFPTGSRPSWYLGRSGLGYRLHLRGEEPASLTSLYYDPSRDRCFDLDELEGLGQGVYFDQVRVLPGRWLAMEKGSGGKRRVWLDPVTGARETCHLFGNREHDFAVIDDGTLLLWTAGGVSVVDPVTGTRREIVLASLAGEPMIINSIRLAETASPPLEPDARVIVLLSLYYVRDVETRTLGSRCHDHPALLDLAAGMIEWPPAEWGLPIGAQVEPLSCTGPRMIGIEDERRIVRYDFETATRAVIFSIDQLE